MKKKHLISLDGFVGLENGLYLKCLLYSADFMTFCQGISTFKNRI